MSQRRPRGTQGEAENAGQVTDANSIATPPTRRKPGPRPGTEAARRGGTAAREKYGKEFYSRIGSKGGSTVRERRGSAFYTEIGRRGGESTKRNLGTEHYSRIGRIGGQRAHGRRDSSEDQGVPTRGAAE
jgi:general stress protein YciG